MVVAPVTLIRGHFLPAGAAMGTGGRVVGSNIRAVEQRFRQGGVQENVDNT